MPSSSRSLVQLFQRAMRLSPQAFEQFLTDMLTPQEISELQLRWEIVQRLHRGIPQREIAQSLGVGIATVTRGSRALQASKGGIKALLA